jgi:hypothetical protein
VLFGDVFLCSGQSNMQFGVHGMFDSEAEVRMVGWGAYYYYTN